MTPSLKFYSAALLSSLLTGIAFMPQAAQALAFGEQDVDQNQFVAIAMPDKTGQNYQLMLLEQVTRSHQCWAENGMAPVSLQFLVPNFERQQLCKQSTNPQDFSIRMAGQDLPQLYELKLIKRNGELFLVGSPKTNSRSNDYPMITIGRTRGISSDYTKIILEPGWRFSKRTVNGTVLGHLYLTNSSPSALAPANVSPGTLNRQTTTVASTQLNRLGSSETAIPIAVPPPEAPSVRTVNSTSMRTAPTVLVSVPPTDQPPAIKLVVPPPESAPTPVNVSMPGRYRPAIAVSTTPTDSSAGIPLPAPPTNTFTRRSPAILPPVDPPLGQTALEPLPSSAGQALPVPPSNIPLGDAGNDPDLIARADQLPPPPVSNLTIGPRIRVLVEVSERDRQTQLRTLVPDAFRSFYQGRPMLQVGSFTEEAKVEEMISLMTSNGFVPVVVKSP